MAAITVARLMANLATFPPGAIVVLAKDAEGNHYSPVEDAGRSVSEGAYEAATTWYGTFYEGVGGKPPHTVDAVCLWPTN